LPFLRTARPASRPNTAALLLSCLPGLLWLAGCGADSVTIGVPSPVTITVTANPASIAAGGSSILSVTASKAAQVTLTGTDGSSYAMAPAGGSQPVTPKATTTYTATATGTNGGTTTATATVTVTAGPATTVSLSANPIAIGPGGSSVLTVAATNATQVVVTGSDNTSYTLQPGGGTQTVIPVATTTYTAVATGANGNVSATATVTVTPSPVATVSISASPTSIAPGSSSTLAVTAANATQVAVTGTDGSSYTLQPAGGSQIVTPTVTTTYTAVATAADGSKVSSTTTVTVVTAAGPTVTISATPASVSAGASTVLTVTAANAIQVTVTGSDGTKLALSSTGGTQTVTPAATTTYTATATGLGATTASAAATVTVIPAATVSITANPTSVPAGGTSTLTVTARNATQVTIAGSDGESYTLSPAGGNQVVTPTAPTTTYTATATSTSGAKVMATATVSVGPAPGAAITATPATISVGGSSTLTITATNATAVSVTGTDGSKYTVSATGGSLTVSPSTTTTYTVLATNASGGKSSSTAIVTVDPAASVAISASPASISPGGSSVLTVTANNATQVTVTGSDGKSLGPLQPTGGTLTVTPSATTVYTATATGAGGSQVSSTTTVTVAPAATVTITANPTSIVPRASSVLTVSATNATQITVTGSDGTSYTTLPASGGTLTVTPAATTAYTATATGAGAPATAKATITVISSGSLQSITHVVFMLQENHTFDNYFGMLNPYRVANGMSVGDDGVTYSVDGIDDKLTTISNQSDPPESVSYSPFKFTSSCVDDMTSGWLESYGDVNRYDFSTTRKILTDGFVHTAEGYANSCQAAGGNGCAGTFSDFTGERAMGYYDQDFLNYYYYMASQFALSDRWFSPMSSKSIPNRIATFTGGTTQGLVLDPGNDDKLPQLPIPTIFSELQKAGVSWKIYYIVSQGGCAQADECGGGGKSYPATIFNYLSDSGPYLYQKTATAPTCTGTTQDSSLPPVSDSSNSFCIDINHIAPLETYYTDLTNETLPSFSFIEAGYGSTDEHPGSGQSMLAGQQQTATIINALMASNEWLQSVFFLSYDEGGGPYDHVPPVATHSNDYTSPSVVANYPTDIGSIAVNADGYNPCVPPTPGTATQHCDLPATGNPGDTANDAVSVSGFKAQLGFRVPNMVISPFTKKHYVSHTPMDHTAIIKFVENRFIGPSAHLTARDAAQPDLHDFFDYTTTPWATPPTPPTPNPNLGPTCTPTTFGGP